MGNRLMQPVRREYKTRSHALFNKQFLLHSVEPNILHNLLLLSDNKIINGMYIYDFI